MEQASELLSELAQNAQEWSNTSKADRAAVAREMMTVLGQDEWSTVDGWAEEEAKLYQIDPSISPFGSDAVAFHRFIIASMLKEMLKLVVEIASPPKKGSLPTVKRRIDANTVAYGPCGILSMPGVGFEVWCNQPEAHPETMEADTTRPARDRVTLVLGAGNQSFLSLVDVLQAVFLDAECVLLKHHPLRPWLYGPFSVLFAPLIKRGIFRHVIDQGTTVSTQLCAHPLVQRVHVTGSSATVKSIEAALERGSPRKECHVTSELGCATPWVILPGTYTAVELRHAARMVVTAKKTSGGNNCLSAQVVVLPRDWPQSSLFLQELRAELKRQPTYPSYYPNARARRRRLYAHYLGLAPLRAESLPAPLIQPRPPLPPTPHAHALAARAHAPEEAASEEEAEQEEDNVCLLHCGVYGEEGFDGTAMEQEAFCAALALAHLPGGGSGEEGGKEEGGKEREGRERERYILEAVPGLLNSQAIYGSLSCSLVVPASVPMSYVDALVGKLHYGTVCINSWAVLGFFSTVTGGGTWGAHPRDASGLRQSGSGLAGNAWRLSHPEKTLVRGPPLTSTPIFDAAKPLPGLLLDVLSAAVTAPSFACAAWRVGSLLVCRFVQTLLRSVGLAKGQRLFGSAAPLSNGRAPSPSFTPLQRV